MKYYDFAKHLSDKYQQSMISTLSKLNLAVWELKGCNSGVIDDTDIVPLEKIIERMISMDCLEGRAVLVSGSPCPCNAFRRDRDIRESRNKKSGSPIHT